MSNYYTESTDSVIYEKHEYIGSGFGDKAYEHVAFTCTVSIVEGVACETTLSTADWMADRGPSVKSGASHRHDS